MKMAAVTPGLGHGAVRMSAYNSSELGSSAVHSKCDGGLMSIMKTVPRRLLKTRFCNCQVGSDES